MDSISMMFYLYLEIGNTVKKKSYSACWKSFILGKYIYVMVTNYFYPFDIHLNLCKYIFLYFQILTQ